MHRKPLTERERGGGGGKWWSRWMYITLWQLIWQLRKIWKWILILCSSSSSSAACDLCPCSLRWSSNLVLHLTDCVPLAKVLNSRPGDQLKPPCISIFISGIWQQELSNPIRPRFKQRTLLFWHFLFVSWDGTLSGLLQGTEWHYV